VQAQSSFPPTCTCFYLWSGSDCSIAACPNNCSQAGTCDSSNGYCTCEAGTGGADCSTDLRVGTCPNNCNSQGTCADSVCTCFEGWSGPDCSVSHCPNNCTFNGVCLELDSSAFFAGYECRCNRGYTGNDCSVSVRPCPTYGGHECALNGGCDGETGKCVCKQGYMGEDCSQRDCAMGYLSRTDKYAPPWTSADCPNDCSCNGYCFCDNPPSEEEPPRCYCACEPGFAGDSCAVVVGKHVPYKGVIQPMPDQEVYPEIHPYLTDEERAGIAQRRQAMTDKEPEQQDGPQDEQEDAGQGR